MPLGSRLRHDERFQEPSAPDDFDRLIALAEAVSAPDFKKRLTDLAKATKVHRDAEAAAVAAQNEADNGIAAAKDEIAKLRAEHDAFVANERSAIEADRKTAAKAAAEAEANQKAAAALVADRRKRLAAADHALTA